MQPIPMFKVNMAPEATDAIADVLRSGMVGEGSIVEKFTEQLRTLFNHQHVVALNSCTSALTLALRLVGITYGDVVVSSPFTMVATNCAIKASGAQIKWAPISYDLCMDLCKACKIIEASNIGAVVITLVGGIVPHHLEEFLEVCARYNTKVIFDAAHALTTTYKGKHICHYAHCTAFSFQSIKHLNTIDGGALVVSNIGNYQRAQKLKWFGMSRDVPSGKTRLEHQMTYKIPEWGYKFHMNNASAAIGLANMQVAQDAVRLSMANAQYYSDNLPKNVVVPVSAHCVPSWWVYPIFVRDPKAAIEKFIDNNIVATQMWPMNYIHKCFPDQEDILLKDYLKPIFIPNGFWVGEEEREHILKVTQEVL